MVCFLPSITLEGANMNYRYLVKVTCHGDKRDTREIPRDPESDFTSAQALANHLQNIMQLEMVSEVRIVKVPRYDD